MILQRNIMEKNAYTNQVCHTLRLRGIWDLVTLTSRVGEGWGEVREEKNNKKNFWGSVLLGRYSLGRGFPIGVAPMQDFKNLIHAMMRQLLLHSILLSYFTSKIFHFFFQQIKASTQLLV